MQASPVRSVGPDVAVDRLVANGELALLGEVSGHLLGAPVPAPQSLYLLPVAAFESLVSPRGRTAPVGLLLNLARAVAAIPWRAVASELPRDRAAMASRLVGNSGRAEARLSKRRDPVSFLLGHLVVVQRLFPMLGRL